MSIEAKTALGHVRQLLKTEGSILSHHGGVVQHALTGSWVTLVRAFNTIFKRPIRSAEEIHLDLSHIEDSEKLMCLNILVEEVLETVEAMGYVFKMNGSKPVFFRLDGEGDAVELADGLGDIIFVCIHVALRFGIDIDRVFREISASNFTKLGADGEAILREDGKILKGPAYMKAALARVVMAASQPLLTEGDSTDA